MKSGEKIRAKAVELLSSVPDGIRYSELARRIHLELPDIHSRSIPGFIWDLDVKRPKEVYKPERGIFRHTKFKHDEAKENILDSDIELATPSSPVKEEDFYALFAEWIKNELEECTKAIPLGGNKFKEKWGTPDVIGIRASRQSDIIKLPTEIVSAEIKVDSTSLITAFGQSCAYKLFSHKSYIVIPLESAPDDLARLDSLCRIFGIGLILFNAASDENPDFQIRVRAAKHEPDMFYVNKYMKLIENELFG